MNTWIALLRGINVGGNNVLPMQSLVSDLMTLKLHDVRTYIQSGNVVFRSRAKVSTTLARKIASCVEANHGFRPNVLVLTLEQLLVAAESNPFALADSQPNTLHLFFLSAPAEDADTQSMQGLATSNEKFQLQGQVFYLHAPDGIGKSRLAAKVEKLLGVPATARNWRTVTKLIELAQN